MRSFAWPPVRYFVPLALVLCLSQAVWASNEILPDPMRPADYVDEVSSTSTGPTSLQPERLELTATYWVGGIRKAVINGQSVREGELIAGAVLVKVTSGAALLRRGEENIALKLLVHSDAARTFFRKKPTHEP